ncbi:HEXXH motif-containing protein [Saccharothrix carnea]|uniref:HEXXH motif-containing protein n=1 Tax=Saccharothrix carnea TaxID=1280637 RepID=A0A2P8I341_SACCR|nr:HEXXH motif-containing putative peptide modification protein [Saccharothrix carnea]PSL52865.1 HEXXH motif-containing protein [Saccharothrix carnea]
MADLAGPHLSAAEFDLICAGPGTPAVMGALRRAQYGRRRLGMRALLELARRDAAHAAGTADAERAWAVLAEAERLDPVVVEDVLMAPGVGLWLARALRRNPEGVERATAASGVLHAVAAAVAVRAGIPARLTVPVTGGVATLPTVGQFVLSESVESVELVCGAGRPVCVNGGERLFRPFRRHRSEARGLSLEVVVDDLDPNRGFAEPTPPNPLDRAEYERWCALLDEAWTLLTEWDSGYATEVSAGLTSLVPLDPGSGVVGASSAIAFGAVALSARASAAEFAETLVHELQHSKLNAVLELVHLHDDGTVKRHYAPWRDDPRPLTGVLHGLYAFISVVEFWHGRAPASFALALRVRQLRLALDSLDTSRLTAAGKLLVDAVSRRLAVCEPAAAGSGHAHLVGMIIADHRATWRIRHVEPRPEDLAALADEWLAGRPRSRRVRGDVVAAGGRADSHRAALLRAKAPDSDGTAPTASDDADVALADGDLSAAASKYLDRVQRNAEDGGAWVGLGLALSLPPLLREPEVVRGLHREITARGGQAADPVSLARWLDA